MAAKPPLGTPDGPFKTRKRRPGCPG